MEEPLSTERRHGRLEEAGRAPVRGWIGHPAVRAEVAAARPALIELAAPLMASADPAEGNDQSHLTLLMVRLLEGAMQRPDEVLPNPFAGSPPEVLASTTAVAPLLIDALRGIARRLAAAGAPLDPEDDGVLLVLAQLVLLDVDLDRPAAAIVEDLNVLPPGWVDREASQLGSIATHASRHASTRTRRDLDAAAVALAAASGLAHIPVPYARGEARPAATTNAAPAATYHDRPGSRSVRHDTAQRQRRKGASRTGRAAHGPGL